MHVVKPRRTPVVAAAALLIGLAVVAGILVVGRLGVPDASPTPSAVANSSTPTAPSPSPTDRLATPEGAARAFFEAFGKARETDDPKLVLPYVTSDASDAYLTVSGFLNGQKAVGKASVLTVNELTGFDTSASGDQATVTFTHHQVGYDIDVKTRAPRESPTALLDTKVQVTLQRSNGRWRVASFENLQ